MAGGRGEFPGEIKGGLKRFMSNPERGDERPRIPQKIGCRVCMLTAELSEQFGEAASVDLAGKTTLGTSSYAIYRCAEGHTTHAAFDTADGSLRIYEPEDNPTHS
jgi:hypothetical protein